MKLRWYIAALLFSATVINYIDRQALSVLAPVITKELGLSDVEYSNILQVFLIAYTLMYVGSGVLVDRWGTKLSLAVFMVWWSASNALHGFARTGMQLGFFRFLLGIGEPGNFMAAFRAISEWFPPGERAFVNGLVNAGAAVGAIVAAPLVSVIALHFGWRSAFVITGTLGFVWLAVWLWVYRLPAAAAATPIKTEKIPWSHLLRYRRTWGLMLARFVSDPVWWFYLFWLPKYLSDVHGFTLAHIGALAWLPYLAADIGAISGGALSGYLIRRGWTVLGARAGGMWPFAAVMPVSLLLPFTHSAPLAIVIICVVAFSHMAWRTNLSTCTNDLYTPSIVGSAAGLLAFGSGLGGTLFTSLTGHIVQNFSYGAVFVIMGFLHPLAFLIFRLLVRAPEET